MSIDCLHKQFRELKDTHDILVYKLKTNQLNMQDFDAFENVALKQHKIIYFLGIHIGCDNKTMVENVFKLSNKNINLLYEFIETKKINNSFFDTDVFSAHVAYFLGMISIAHKNIDTSLLYLTYAANINYNLYGYMLWIFRQTNRSLTLYYIDYNIVYPIEDYDKIFILNIPERLKNCKQPMFLCSIIYYLNKNNIECSEEAEYGSIYGCCDSQYYMYHIYSRTFKYPKSYTHFNIDSQVIAENYAIMAFENGLTTISPNVLNPQKYKNIHIKYLQNTMETPADSYYSDLLEEYNKLKIEYQILKNKILYAPGGTEYHKCKLRFNRLSALKQ